jgi:hypothetical protein
MKTTMKIFSNCDWTEKSKDRKAYLNSLLDFQEELLNSYDTVAVVTKKRTYTYKQINKRVWKRVRNQV